MAARIVSTTQRPPLESRETAHRREIGFYSLNCQEIQLLVDFIVGNCVYYIRALKLLNLRRTSLQSM